MRHPGDLQRMQIVRRADAFDRDDLGARRELLDRRLTARSGLPSTITVQEPHWPSSQQTLQPVSSICSRKTSARVAVFSATTQRSTPFTFSSVRFMSSLLQSFEVRGDDPAGLAVWRGADFRRGVAAFRLRLWDFALGRRGDLAHVAHRRTRGVRLADGGDHFGDDRNGDFLRRHRADVQADGRVDAGELLVADPVQFQLAVDELHLTPRSDHADVGGGRIHRPAQRARVERVAARGDEDERAAVRLQRRQRRLRFPGVDRARVGEALLVGELRPVVDHLDLDARQLGRLSGEAADVTRAEEVGDRRRTDHLDEDVEAAAAHHAEIHAGILVQIEGDQLRLAGGERLLRLADHRRLAGAAADGADDRAVFAHQHLRRLIGRNRAGRVDDDRQRAAAPRVALANELLIDVHRSRPL